MESKSDTGLWFGSLNEGVQGALRPHIGQANQQPISRTQLQLSAGSVSFDFMRLLRVLLVGLFGVFALIAGLFTAALVGVATAFILFVRRVLRQPDAARLPRQAPSRVRANSGDVIDVTATELPVDSTPR